MCASACVCVFLCTAAQLQPQRYTPLTHRVVSPRPRHSIMLIFHQCSIIQLAWTKLGIYLHKRSGELQEGTQRLHSGFRLIYLKLIFFNNCSYLIRSAAETHHLRCSKRFCLSSERKHAHLVSAVF